MFQNSGLDQRFLADIHNIASHLKDIKELQQIALVKIANDLGSLFAEKQARQKLLFLKNVISSCNPDIWAEAEKQMNLVFQYEDPFEKEDDDNADEE